MQLLSIIAMRPEEHEAMNDLGMLSGTRFWVDKDIRSVEFRLSDDGVDG